MRIYIYIYVYLSLSIYLYLYLYIYTYYIVIDLLARPRNPLGGAADPAGRVLQAGREPNR